MDLMRLKYFMTIASCEHMTHAAELLHIAQPALTQSMHALEKELDVRLFEHRGRNIVLTDAGRWLQGELAPILSKLDSLPERIQEVSGRQRSTIKIRVMAATILITEAIIHFKQLYPEVEFKLMRAMDEQQCDIKVSTGTDVAPQPNSRIFVEEVFIGVSNGTTLAERNSITLKELKDENFISLSGSSPLRMLCDCFCRSAGIVPHVAVESDSPTAVRDMIAAGMGIGFWPAYSWGNIADGHITLLPITDMRCHRTIILSRFFNDDLPLHTAFWNSLQNEIKAANRHAPLV